MLDFVRIYLVVCSLLILNGLVQLIRVGAKASAAQAIKRASAQASAQRAAQRAEKQAQATQAEHAAQETPRKRGRPRKRPEGEKPTAKAGKAHPATAAGFAPSPVIWSTARPASPPPVQMPQARAPIPAVAYAMQAQLAPEVYTLAQFDALTAQA